MDGNNGTNGSIVGLLARIADRLDTMDQRIQGLRTEVQGLRTDTNRGFAQVNARIDNVLAISGGHHDDHEQRLQVLEERVLGKSGGR